MKIIAFCETILDADSFIAASQYAGKTTDESNSFLSYVCVNLQVWEIIVGLCDRVHGETGRGALVWASLWYVMGLHMCQCVRFLVNPPGVYY